MTRWLALFRGLLVRNLWLPVVVLWLTSVANWFRLDRGDVVHEDRLDLVLELELLGAGILLAHVVLRDCPRRVMEYLATLPLPRAQSLAAPLHTASATLLVVSLLLLAWEHSGATWLVMQALSNVLLLSVPEFAARPIDPWITALVLPQAGFWLTTAALRAWCARHARDGGRYVLGAAVCLPAVALAAGAAVFANHAGLPAPWHLVAPALPWLLLTWLAHHATLRELATAPTDTYPLGETP